MLKKVRKFLKNNSPDWLNTEVNKNLLQNLSTNINCSPRPNLGAVRPTEPIGSKSLRDAGAYAPSDVRRKGTLTKTEGLGERAKIQPASKRSISSNSDYAARSQSDRQFSTDLSSNGENSLQFPTPGTPHWRRIKQVFVALDNAPANYTYSQLIGYVRETTGKGCSRKLISKWKKQKSNQNIPDNNSGDRHTGERTPVISAPPAIVNIPSTACPRMGVNSLQLNNNNSLIAVNRLPMTVKAWSYLTAAGMAVSLVGCEIIPFNNHPSENVAIASVTAPITPLTPIPERRKNRLEPRTIKIELTLSSPQDLKVKPGDKISAGQALSDRVSERNRLQAKKKQLQISLEKLNLRLTPIPQPKPIPEIRPLPPVSYAESEAAIKLKQQKLTEAERAISLQKKKIDFLNGSLMGETPKTAPVRSLTQLGASPSNRLSGGGDIKLILEHERANLNNLEAARQSAQIQLEVQESKLTTAKERRAYIEYQRQLEQTRRAIAIEQQHQAIQRQESERERLLAEREYSQAQIETQIQTLDYQIEQLSSVRAPYEGTIKKVKWTGQSDHNLTAVVTLAVNSDRPTLANSTSKPTPNTEAKQTTQAQP